MKNNIVRKITLSGLLIAIVIVMQIIKNVNPYISGPVINTCLVLATILVGYWWGIGFCIGVPLMSLLIAPASGMSLITHATFGASLVIVIIGNIIFVTAAYLFRNTKFYFFILALIVGATLKWLFMWGSAELILVKLFANAMNAKLTKIVSNVFSTLQLFSGLISVVIIVPLKEIYRKIN